MELNSLTMLGGNVRSAKGEILVDHVNWALTRRARDKVHRDLTSKTVLKADRSVKRSERKARKKERSCQSGTWPGRPPDPNFRHKQLAFLGAMLRNRYEQLLLDYVMSGAICTKLIALSAQIPLSLCR